MRRSNRSDVQTRSQTNVGSEPSSDLRDQHTHLHMLIMTPVPHIQHDPRTCTGTRSFTCRPRCLLPASGLPCFCLLLAAAQGSQGLLPTTAAWLCQTQPQIAKFRCVFPLLNGRERWRERLQVTRAFCLRHDDVSGVLQICDWTQRSIMSKQHQHGSSRQTCLAAHNLVCSVTCCLYILRLHLTTSGQIPASIAKCCDWIERCDQHSTFYFVAPART